MVDPVNPSGSVQNILSVGKAQKFEDQKSEKTNSTPVDEVSLSDEAKIINNAQKSAKAVASYLSSTGKNETLSSDINRLNTLI